MFFAIERFGLSARKACSLIGLCRNTIRYQGRSNNDKQIRKRMREIAQRRRRFGCRRIHVMLKREGLVVNHKKTERLYREEQLSLKIRKRKKFAAQARVELPKPERVNQQWAMDFVSDSLSNGRRIRTLPIIDHYTRECLKIVVDTSIGGKRVARELSELAWSKGLPDTIVVDNGPEFISNALDAWAYQRGVKLQFIRPGKPVENAFMESFNGRFRDECLNDHWFLTLDDAKEKIEQWRMDYNQNRPHSSLNDLTPAEFAQNLATIT